MNEFPIHKLIELVNFDQAVHKLRVEIKELQTELEVLEKQIDQINEELKMVENSFQDTKQEVTRKELEMKELDEAEKKASQRLESAQDQKEYQSIKKEIEHLKAKQHDFEEELVAAWNAAEAAERDYKTKQASHDEAMKKLQSAIAELRERIDEKQHAVTDSEVNRVEMLQGIPDEWLEKYERMQSRVANPIVTAVDGSCSACNFKILAQDMARLTNRALLQCKNCYRFLYLESALQG